LLNTIGTIKISVGIGNIIDSKKDIKDKKGIANLDFDLIRIYE